MTLQVIFYISAHFCCLEISNIYPKSFMTYWNWQFGYQAVHLIFRISSLFFKVFAGLNWLLGENFSKKIFYENFNSSNRFRTLGYVDT